MKIKKRHLSENLPGIIASAGVLLLLGLFPLFVTESYHNITITKYLYFVIVSASIFALCLITRIASGKPIDTSKLNPKNPTVSYPDIFMVLFLLVSFASCISSPYRFSALGGGAGRRMGLIMIFALTFAYFFISKFYTIRKTDLKIFGGVFAFSCLIALVQSLGFDPFDLYAKVPETSKVNFVAFIGNVNVFSSFVSLGAGFSAYMFCREKEKKSSVFWLAVSFISFFGLFTSNSDSTYIAFLVIYALLAIMTSKEKESFERFFVLIFLMFFAAGLFSILRLIKGEGVYKLPFLTELITNFKIVIAGLVISTIFILIIRLTKIPNSVIIVLNRIIIGMIGVVSVALIATFVYFSWINTDAQLGNLENYLRFSDDWGTYRGFVWDRLLTAFKGFPLTKKLIGCGPDTVALILKDVFGEESTARPGYYFDNAHNDLIQYLVTVGISGLLSYVLLLVTVLSKSFKSESVEIKALAFAIVVFFAQSMFNIIQPITTPLFFVFIALTQCSVKE